MFAHHRRYVAPEARPTLGASERSGRFGHRVKPSLHTELTTRSALVAVRRLFEQKCVVLVKSVPVGPVVELEVLTSFTAQHLHHLFRANSRAGVEQDLFMYLPTAEGLLALDVGPNEMRREKADRLPSPGDVPLSRYGLNQPNAKLVLFHGAHRNMCTTVERFVNNNLLLDTLPNATKVHTHLDDVPKHLPGTDKVQHLLCNIFKLQVQQHKQFLLADVQI